MILNHELKLGEKLNVRELSEKLGISFTPVRDALLQLATEGLVKVVPRVGFFVTDVDERFIRETIETRIMMEVFCLENYFERIASSEELLKIKEEIENVESSLKRDLFDDADERLHKLFIKASGNELIISLYEKIWDRIDLVRHLNERYIVSNREHKELIESILRGDKEDAVEKLKKHLKNVEEETIRNLYTYEKG
jgi:DNA-binding GntR family transcriptional regulator